MITYWGYTLVDNIVRNTVHFASCQIAQLGERLEKSIISSGHSHSFANLNASLLSFVNVISENMEINRVYNKKVSIK
jgi:hypothetical protein